MVRKIPGRKHHGVKDPEKQRLEKEKKIKNKINAAPTNPDEQEIPNKLKKIIELKNKVKNNNKIIKNQPNIITKKKSNTEDNQRRIPNFIQFQGETNEQYLSRVKGVCELVKNEAIYKNMCGMKIRHDPSESKNELKNEIVEMIKEAKKKQKIKIVKSKGNKEKKLTKSQKRQRKIKVKKMEKKKNEDYNKDFEQYKDPIQFGEQVHAPPNLKSVLPRKVTAPETVPRPGSKDLLLKNLLNKTENNTRKIKKPNLKKIKKPLKNVKTKPINRKGKRKDLPVGLRRQLDKEQSDIIQVYKSLKQQKKKK